MNDFRKIKPVPTGTINFKLPSPHIFEIPNKNKLIVVQKNDLPITQIEVIIEGGSRFDLPGKAGLSFLTAMMLDEGAGKYTGLELNNEFEKLGSIISLSSDKDMIYITLLSLAEHLERSLELLSMVINEPTFTEQDFKREKNSLRSKILQSIDSPSSLTSNIFDRLIFSESGYRNCVFGVMENVENLERDDISTFYNDINSTGNSTIIVVGSESPDKVYSLFSKFMNIQIPAAIESKPYEGNLLEYGNKIFIINDENAAQSEIRIGHRSAIRNTPDYFARHLMNAVLGGQFSSRINHNLREDKGYTYGVGSYFDYYRNDAKFLVSTSVQSEVTTDAVKQIFNELEGIRNGVTVDELNFAKSYITNRFPALFETYSQITNNLATAHLHNLPSDYFNNYLENINRVSIAEVNSAAQNHIHPDRSVILIHGNKDQFAADLEKVMDMEIIELDKNGEIKN